jgi:hypothetical protein
MVRERFRVRVRVRVRVVTHRHVERGPDEGG